MSKARPNLSFGNRQRTHRIDLHKLRLWVESLIGEFPEIQETDLSVCVVAEPEMVRLNETFLRHAGSTDVITFDYSDSEDSAALQGDVFVCIDEAVIQSRRFKTTWQLEIVRYTIHGILHLLGHDDHRVVARRRMKREENRLLKLMAKRFALRELERRPKVAK